MLDTTPEAMWLELEGSRKQVESRLYARKEMIERYHGAYFEQNVGQTDEPENPAFEWIATMGGDFNAGDPQCWVKPTRGDRPMVKLRADALRYSLNRLARDGDHKTTYRKLFVDWTFGPAITCISRRPAPWADRGPLSGPVQRPHMARISPTWQRYDARATDWDETRWRGHGQIVSKSTLQKWAKSEPGWRTDELNDLETEVGLKDVLPKGTTDIKRDDFKLWTVWVPEEQPDRYSTEDGFWGTVHTYAESGRSQRDGSGSVPLREIRDPQPYYGPRMGMYCMSGQYYVPDSVHPLSIMVAIESISRALRLQARVIDAAMKDYKRFIIEGSGEKHLGRLLKNARHGGIVKAKGFTREMAQEFTIGGIDANMDAMYRFQVERLDRRYGLSATQRGEPQSGATATAETLAAGGSSARTAGLRDAWYDFVRANFRAMAEIIDGDDEFLIPTPPELIQQIGAPYIRGGRQKGESFEDYELNIQPFSMRYRSEQDAIAAADRELAMFGQLAPLSVQAPHIDWTGVLQDQADATGQPELPQRFNSSLAMQLAALFLQGAMQPQQGDQPGQARPTPTTAKDLPQGRQAATPAQVQVKQAGQDAATLGRSSGSRAGSAAQRTAKAGY